MANIGGHYDTNVNDDVWDEQGATTTLTEYITGLGTAEITFYYLSDE
ncbi:MAG: hypothetical protein LUE91_03145 [Oscillospiraceae bacterium]|nr:hypothetical protein [Oscillospiraceae bacterium]